MADQNREELQLRIQNLEHQLDKIRKDRILVIEKRMDDIEKRVNNNNSNNLL